MRPFNNRKKFLLIPFAVVAFLAAIAYVVMMLWNNLLPDILHVGIITYWQALGIFVLCKILFGFGKGGGRGMRGGGAPWMRGKMEDRFKNMSAEERERFKDKIRNRCGKYGWDENKWDNFKPEAEKTAE